MYALSDMEVPVVLDKRHEELDEGHQRLLQCALHFVAHNLEKKAKEKGVGK